MFDKPLEAPFEPTLPERLIRLNKDLTSGEKRRDVLHGTHAGSRIKIIVERVHAEPRRWSGDRDYKAIAVFGGKEYFRYGYSPSDAFIRLAKQELSWAVDKHNFSENMVGSVVPMPQRKAA